MRANLNPVPRRALQANAFLLKHTQKPIASPASTDIPLFQEMFNHEPPQGATRCSVPTTRQ